MSKPSKYITKGRPDLVLRFPIGWGYLAAAGRYGAEVASQLFNTRPLHDE